MRRKPSVGQAELRVWWVLATLLALLLTTAHVGKAAPLSQPWVAVNALTGNLQADPLNRANSQLITPGGVTYAVVGSTPGLDLQIQQLARRAPPVRVKVWGQLVGAVGPARNRQIVVNALVVLNSAPTVEPMPLPTPSPTVPPTPTTPFATSVPTRLPLSRWQAAYFANPNLAGPPVFSTQAPAVDFNWGNGSPAPAVPADQFSARFEQRVNLPAGFYVMRAQADDGIRVYVNNELVIDEWRLGQPPVYRVGRQLVGPTTFRVEYYEAGGKASIRFTYDLVDNFPEWKVAYFNNIALQGAPSWIEPETRSSAGAINQQWSLGSPVPGVVPVDNWSARWTGAFNFETGNYLFWADADDGVRLWLDDHLVIDAWHDASGKTQNAFYGVGAGSHQVRVEYYARGGLAHLKVDCYQLGTSASMLAMH